MDELDFIVGHNSHILLELVILESHVVIAHVLGKLIKQITEERPDFCWLSTRRPPVLGVVLVLAIPDIVISELLELVHVIYGRFKFLVALEKVYQDLVILVAIDDELGLL